VEAGGCIVEYLHHVGYGRHQRDFFEGGILLTKERAHDLIRAGAAKAVQACKHIPPYKVKSPVTMRVELVSRRLIPDKRRPVKILDGRTYEVTGNTVEETLRLL